MKFGLIGEVLGHSLSPVIHEEIMKATGANGSYHLVEIPKDRLESGLREAFDNYDGLNVTIPYKTAVMPFLDEIAPEAEAIGAVNTIAFKDGKAIGYNTDYTGFRMTLRKIGADVAGRRCVVLGNGGASRAVIRCLADEGADISVVSRRPRDTGKEFEDFLAAAKGRLMSYDDFEENPRGCLLVNATPVGMYPKTGVSPVSPRAVAAFPKVIDLIYNPPETLFLSYAGGDKSNGLTMLVAQAVAAEEIWRGENLGEVLAETIAERMRDEG